MGERVRSVCHMNGGTDESSYANNSSLQVPEGIDKNTVNICVARTSPNIVKKAYYKQFQNNFSKFLKYRAMERMVLTMLGRTSEESYKDDYLILELLAEAINDMVSEGLIEEKELHSFNIPHYAPSSNEISTLIQEEGSFIIDHLQTFQIHWKAYKNNGSSLKASLFEDDGFHVMKAMRSVLEPQLLLHEFDEGILDG